MNDRRSTARTRIDKGALLFFSGQIGVRSCCVTDITNVGAGIRTEDLPVPRNFELSFDIFRTIRKCRLIWRDGDLLGVALKTNTASRAGSSCSRAHEAPSGKSSAASFRSEGEYSQHGCRSKDQWYVIHKHNCSFGRSLPPFTTIALLRTSTAGPTLM